MSWWTQVTTSMRSKDWESLDIRRWEATFEFRHLPKLFEQAPLRLAYGPLPHSLWHYWRWSGDVSNLYPTPGSVAI